jgi:hypothetical protein
MSAWNFKHAFSGKILDGKKLTTIRRCRVDKKDPKIGQRVKLFTGMRTLRCSSLGTVEVVERKKISIQVIGEKHVVTLDDRELGNWELLLLAADDGFDSIASFLDFFSPGMVGYWYRFVFAVDGRCNHSGGQS